MLSNDDRLEQHIGELADFLSRGPSLPFERFDKSLRERLGAIEALSQTQPALRDAYRKRCFDLCAFALDSSPILRRLRYKPLGSRGDFEALEQLYTGTKTTFWDEFAQQQDIVQGLRNSQYLAEARSSLSNNSRVLLLNPVYHEIQEVFLSQAATTALYCVDAEPKALDLAKTLLDNASPNSLYFYERLGEVRGSFDFIYAPYVLHCLGADSAGKLLAEVCSRLGPGGSILLYQLQANHSLKAFMEWCLDWTLYYHHEASLQALCQPLAATLTLHQQGSWLRLVLRK